MNVLRQSTAATIKLGPFLDDADGKTAEDGLVIAKASVRLSANGGNMAAASADQGVADAGAPHDELGYYDVSLDTTDTATAGRLKVMVSAAGALPVWCEYQVVEEVVYDMLYAASAIGYVANAAVNAAQISGDSTAADILELFAEALNAGTGQIDAGTLADDTITAASINTGALTADAFAANALVAATFAASALNGKGDWNVDKTGYSLTNLTVTAGTTLAAGTHTAQTGDGYPVASKLESMIQEKV